LEKVFITINWRKLEQAFQKSYLKFFHCLETALIALRPVVPNLFSVVDPFDNLAKSCGPSNKINVQVVSTR